jgi:4-hydroxythreonine-4-phosphate dehydrogenase
MGDPAGVGPEIALAAVTDPGLADAAHMLVVGSRHVLERAAACLGREIILNETDSRLARPEALREGVCNYIECGTLPSSFVYGRVDAACGKAAYDCIVKAVELAKDGLVDALATTPINKEALNAAGIDYIGHTEILAALTGTQDPLTMFQVRELRVFFLTRHMSLQAACRSVTEERVYQYIARCGGALARLGIDKPRVAVAGLNPHCGEHGLFGDEEDAAIAPAVERARKEGFDAHGPKPADSVFHFALGGAWDCVLSLYHDQGHIATKMVDFERTIALTHGLPFLRTSVDHGTAFDIAGTGKAGALSMVEAIRLAALYAPQFRR